MAAKRFSGGHRVSPVLAVFVFAVIFVLTLGKAYFSVPGLWEAQAHEVRQLRLIPFETFIHPRVWWGPWFNLFGNIALFVPVGWVFFRDSVRRATLCGLLLSLGIETAQYILAVGFSDLDDVWCNTLGTYLGARAAAAWYARPR
ncbi:MULTISPECIES: VanZ family protein [Corynebacterium]|uniref:VanZ family protein n=1 Tax=Corynebacterium TaxID=1716 RepID=UPI0009F26FD2|nr:MULTISPECIES: VanZ family protein [Corynebacterium]QQU84475.1 VanZ family protein [Corynebacterium riegelii]